MLVGYVGADPRNPAALGRLLEALGPRAAGLRRAEAEGIAIAAPWARRLPDGSLAALCGRLLPVHRPQDQLAEDLAGRVAKRGVWALADADGGWALCVLRSAAGELVLAHDHFGAYQLYYSRVGDGLWFSSSMRALLALPAVAASRALDLVALHGYLTFSYVPAPRTLFANVRCLPPHTAVGLDVGAGALGEPRPTPLLAPRPPAADAPIDDEPAWIRLLSERFDEALDRRVGTPGEPVGLALSGGLDSSAVLAGLISLGVPCEPYFLDFGPPYDEERPFAEAVAGRVGVALRSVPVRLDPRLAGTLVRRVVWGMDQPYGDPVTLPLWLGNRDVAARGLPTVFNGEGGDQLFAGWPTKSMMTAEVYGASARDASYDRAAAYVRTFHHFSDPAAWASLYGPELAAAAAERDLRDEVAPYLDEPALPGLFERLRWTNYWTKGGQNILPRAAAMARAHGTEMRSPLFDVALARFALTLPGPLLLRGATEKYAVKRLLEHRLPASVVGRPKRGMGVPATEWCLGPLRRNLERWLGKSLIRRGLFRADYIRQLLKGDDLPHELRGRRVGEKLWQLAVLEVWLELFHDRIALVEP